MCERIKAAIPRLALLASLALFGCDDGGGGGAGGAGGDAPDGGGVGGEGGDGGGGAGGVGGGMDCVPGTLTCPCADDGTCGAGLACELGFCVPEEPPECDPGMAGCACADGMCAAGLACTDDVCVPAGCEAGTANCNCDGGACDGELACIDNICQMSEPPPQDSLSVSGGDLRGCDLLFQEGAVPVARVQFADGLIAEWLRRDGKVALAFVGPGGAPISNVGAIVLANEQVATAAELELLEARCYDANGRQVAEAVLNFD